MLSLSLTTLSATAIADDELSVLRPFTTLIARENVVKCKPELKNDLDNLARIELITYSFDPIFNPDKRPPPTIGNRTITIAMPELSQAALSQQLTADNKNTCEEANVVSDVRRTFSDSKSMQITLHFYQRKTECGKIFGVPYTSTRYRVNGDLAINVRLNDQLEPYLEGEPITSNVHVEEGSLFKLIGFFTGTTLLIDKVIFPIVAKSKKKAAESTTKALAKSKAEGRFFLLTSGVDSIGNFAQAVDAVEEIDVSMALDIAKSGFVDSEIPKMQIVEFKRIDPAQIRRIHSIRKGEIRYLKDLLKPTPQYATVRKGRGVWDVANATYLDPRIFIVIEDWNSLRDRVVHPGQKVRIPLLYELCEQMIVADAMVRPRDSLTAIGQRKGRSVLWSKKDFRSGKRSLIYPYEGFKLRGNSAQKAAGTPVT